MDMFDLVHLPECIAGEETHKIYSEKLSGIHSRYLTDP